MPVPDFQSFMLPLLKFASDGKTHSLAEARDALALAFELTDAERQELLPGGSQTRFDNRVAWSKVYLTHAGLLAAPKRGLLQLTDRGREELGRNII